MTAKDQKITLKTLMAEVVTLKEELFQSRNDVGELQEGLKIANEEIKRLKDIKNQKENAHVSNHDNSNPPSRVKCKFCDDMFDKNSELEEHIKKHHDSIEKFKCDQCGKSFVLEWRLGKHKRIHTERKMKRCHYFNNQKNCPFEEIGCMFEHSYSGNCKYGIKCEKAMCSFQHNNKGVSFECEECDLILETETELGKHMDEKHEGWKVTQSFCDYFCRGEHGMHICWSNEDFQEYIGFDIWETRTTMESEDLFKCLRCERTDDDRDKMREHIEAKHKKDKASKCNYCGYEDKTWLGLKKHYKINHMNQD